MTESNSPPENFGPDQAYIHYLLNQTIALPKCNKCNELHFFPRVICPYCGDNDLEWQTISGKGEVYSTTTIRRKAERGGDYNVSLISLEEGPRMMSCVKSINSELIKIGDKVIASINNEGNEPFVVFTPCKDTKLNATST